MKPRASHRYRVSMRPRVMARRARAAAAFAAVISLGALAAVTARHFLKRGGPAISFSTPECLRAASVEVAGIPSAYLPPIQAVLSQGPVSMLANRSASLRERFPFVVSIRVSRGWISRKLTYTLAVKPAIARVLSGTVLRGYLGEDGTIFPAPKALYPEERPSVDLGSSHSENLTELARLLGEAGRAAGALAPAESLSWISPRDGWKLRLADGTTILWGDLRWSDQKWEKLLEAVAQARAEFGEVSSVDLRYFEDGRILIRPGASAGNASPEARRYGSPAGSTAAAAAFKGKT